MKRAAALREWGVERRPWRAPATGIGAHASGGIKAPGGQLVAAFDPEVSTTARKQRAHRRSWESGADHGRQSSGSGSRGVVSSIPSSTSHPLRRRDARPFPDDAVCRVAHQRRPGRIERRHRARGGKVGHAVPSAQHRFTTRLAILFEGTETTGRCEKKGRLYGSPTTIRLGVGGRWRFAGGLDSLFSPC
jgi:hypothetical protein